MIKISFITLVWRQIFILLLCFILGQYTSMAATNVSGNVFGTWTLAGSPYLVTNVIQVANGQSLTIEPGVDVIFQGFYRFIINGQLKVMGTAAQPITFKAQDTTGWYNDAISNGGWRGIQFNAFQGAGTDSSVINYAVIQDVKHGMNANANSINALAITNRTMLIANSAFTHNQSTHNLSDGRIIQIYNTGNYEVTMDNCRVYNNFARVAIIQLSSGKGRFRKNHWYNNQGGSTFFGLLCESLIEENEIDNNTHIYDMSAIRVDGKYNTIRKNKIHHNTADRLGAIMCTMGKTTIEQNLICNNQTLQGNCGPTDGGGAIHISHNNNAVWDSTFYIVRNNVIANNHCAFNGGGVYVYNCKADILNNQFVHNTAQYAGSALYNIGAVSRLNIKNNLFYRNGNPNGPSINQVYLLSCDSLWFDYNWGQNPLYNQLLLTNLAPNFIGDTSHCVVAANPFLINPTTQTGINIDATNANFNLTAQSTSCINQGNTNAGPVGNFDFLGNTRIQGSQIDIGAFEYPITIGDNITDINPATDLLYPNPATDFIRIESKHADLKCIYLLNALAQCLVQQPCIDKRSCHLDINKIPAGTYLVCIQTQVNTYRYYNIQIKR